MARAADNALIVQSDGSVLLEVHAPRAEEARAALAPFAELVKSPEHVHTYRLTPLSIWNARAAGLAVEQMVESLREHARYPVPPGVWSRRSFFTLVSRDTREEEFAHHRKLFLTEQGYSYHVRLADRA